MIFMKTNIPKIKKQEVWYHYIGDEIGKIKCLCCNINDITQLEFHCGHILPKSKGGEMSLNNLRPICSKCNLSMGNENMIEFMNRLKYDTCKIILSEKHIWTEEDEKWCLLYYKFPDKYDLEQISKDRHISLSSIKMKISNYKSLDGKSNLNGYSKLSKNIYDKYKNYTIEELEKELNNDKIEISSIMRQNQWGVHEDVFGTIKLTNKLICPSAHINEINKLFNKNEYNNQKYSNIFIKKIQINNYVLILDRQYKKGLIVKILSNPKTEKINNVIILRDNTCKDHNPISNCIKCNQSVKMVFSTEYFKNNSDKFIEFLNEKYHFENMYAIIRDIEIIGEIDDTNILYQKYKCFQGTICIPKEMIEINIKDITFISTKLLK